MRLVPKILVTALATACPSLAFAGPLLAAVPFIAGYLGASLAVQAGIAIGLAIYGAAQQRKAAKRAAQKARDDYNASLQDRTLTSITADAPYRYVYGRAKVGSTIIAMFTSGDKDQYKHLVCVHASHQSDAIEEVYINGDPLGALDFETGEVLAGKYRKALSDSANDEYFSGLQVCTLRYPPIAGSVFAAYLNTTDGLIYPVGVVSVVGNVVTLDSIPPEIVTISYQYTVTAGTVWVKKHLGVPGDTVDSSLNEALPALWRYSDTVSGFTYTVIKLDLNQPEFQTSIPSIEVLLRGRRVADPRTGTVYWSQNPALCLYDYLLSPLCGVQTGDIPVDSVITAANVCDINESFGKKYTCNGVITADQSQPDVIDALVDSMAGTIVATTWEMTAGSYVGPVLSLTQEDIVGSLSVNPGPSNTAKFNGVKGQYTGAETIYTSTDYKPYRNATYAAIDGEDIFINQTFPFTDSTQRVHNLCRILTEDSRNGYTIKAELSMKAWGVRVGERIAFTSSFLGITNKVFRITDKSYKPGAPITLTFKEDSASIWDYADSVTPDDTPNTELPNPFIVNPLTGLVATSGDDDLYVLSDGSVVTRVHLTWNPATTQSVTNGGNIELEWRQTGSSIWLRSQVDGGSVSAYVTEVKDGQVYVFRARAVNPYLGVKSDWIYYTHQVVGKLAPPPDVESFSVIEHPNFGRYYNWQYTATPPKDLHGFLVRYSAGLTPRPWSASVPLFEAGALDRSHSASLPGDGDWTFLIRAVDTTGNLSPNAKVLSVFFDSGAFGLPLTSVSAEALGWPGIYDGGIDGYALIDKGTLTWDSIPDKWDDWTDWDGPSVRTLHYEHTVYDLGSSQPVLVREYHVASGTTVAEYQSSTDNITYTAWGPVPSGSITTRYLKFRWTITGDFPILYRAGFNLYTPA